MPVERMEMMSALGSVEDMDAVSGYLVEYGYVHIINALADLNSNVSEYLAGGVNTLRGYSEETDDSELRGKVRTLFETFGLEGPPGCRYIDENMGLDEMSARIEPVYGEAVRYRYALEEAMIELKRMIYVRDNMKYISDVRFSILELKGLKFFKFSMGRLRRESYAKIKANIENIPSVIYEVNSTAQYTVIICFTPWPREQEVSGILKSLNYEEIRVPERARGTPRDIAVRLETLIDEKQTEMGKIRDKIKKLSLDFGELVKCCSNILEKYEMMHQISSRAVRTDNVFMVTGWIPSKERETLEKGIESRGRSTILYCRDHSEVKGGPAPTRLVNSKWAKPFEYLVRMYGIPSYDESDPTPFFAVSYMIMFGSMFGDIGQGFVLFLGGLYLSRMRHMGDFGGILERVGLSSMVFGLLYGSVFGNEDIIRPLLFHPLTQINNILLGGVILGVIFTTVSYIYNFANSLRMKELEEGVFGREGIAGFILYWSLLLTVFAVYRYGTLQSRFRILPGLS
jgi:V/A-type H+-transporting ATPase subunit I